MRSRSPLIALLCAAAMTAEFVAGKATRDALFLTHLGASALPMMLIATAFASMLLVVVHLRATRRVRAAVLVPRLFLASGALFVLEWYLRPFAPSAISIVLYLHVSGAGPLLASGFWLLASDRFDPHTAKARFGQIAGAGTLGGVLGAVISERVASGFGTPTMLMLLAGLQLLAAGLVYALAGQTPASRPADAARPADLGEASLSGIRAVAAAPHLRHMVMLVVLGTTSAALLEFVFKARAVDTFGSGDQLLRFFAVYYGVTSLLSFVLQVAGSGAVLEGFGLALTTASPSIAVLAGGAACMFAPGFGSLVVARASESVLRASWFRAGYELFFTPISAEEKRAAKPVIDVAFDRLGDAVAGGIARVATFAIPMASMFPLIAIAMLCSIGALVAASQLNRWYLRTLERSLVKQGDKIERNPSDDLTARMLSVVRRAHTPTGDVSLHRSEVAAFLSGVDRERADEALADVQSMLTLQFGAREAIIRLLGKPEGLKPGHIPYVIPLLGRSDVSDHAMFALRKVAEEHVGAYVDALLDPNLDYDARRRLARVFSVCVSQRAADGLVLALDDERFEVRYQTARSLLSMVDRNPAIRLDRARIEQCALDEINRSRPIWEGNRRLTPTDEGSPIDGFVKVRASRSLSQVIALLSLIVPREPLEIAFEGLHSDDDRLRGTALEYLEEVLPSRIRLLLWPYLVDQPIPHKADRRGRSTVIADLVQARASLTLSDLAANPS